MGGESRTLAVGVILVLFYRFLLLLSGDEQTGHAVNVFSHFVSENIYAQEPAAPHREAGSL